MDDPLRNDIYFLERMLVICNYFLLNKINLGSLIFSLDNLLSGIQTLDDNDLLSIWVSLDIKYYELIEDLKSDLSNEDIEFIKEVTLDFINSVKSTLYNIKSIDSSYYDATLEHVNKLYDPLTVNLEVINEIKKTFSLVHSSSIKWNEEFISHLYDIEIAYQIMTEEKNDNFGDNTQFVNDTIDHLKQMLLNQINDIKDLKILSNNEILKFDACRVVNELKDINTHYRTQAVASRPTFFMDKIKQFFLIEI